MKDLRISGRKIISNVAGTRVQPYKVTVEIPAFTSKEKESLTGAILNNPLLLSRLLNRELPGAIDLTVSGGTQPYSFEWSNGANTEDIADLPVGEYSVKITDVNNFRWTLDSLIVSGANGLTVYSTVVHNSSSEGGNGSIDITVEGGTPPYIYLWSDGSTEADRSGLTEGIYGLDVTDDNGCLVSYEYQIKKYDFITDERDGQGYPIVQIGDDWWMAKNLNYDHPTSFYPDSDSLKYAGAFGSRNLIFNSFSMKEGYLITSAKAILSHVRGYSVWNCNDALQVFRIVHIFFAVENDQEYSCSCGRY